MKKAKMMLTAICLLSVVGGVLAFKTHKFTGKYFCSTTVTAFCPVVATRLGILTTTLYCTTNPLAPVCARFINVRRNS